MRRPLKIGLVAAAGVGLVAGVVALAPPAVQAAAGGTFVANVPWSSAVIASRSATTLTVLGDMKGMDDRFDCGPTVRPQVTESATTVSIRVRVFNQPLPPNVGCAGVGLDAVQATVHLKAPLGDRVVVDSTGRDRHPVLIVDREPTITAVKAPFVRKATGWDESTGRVGEWWRWQQHHESQQIDLDFGPTGAGPHYPAPPAGATHPSIGGAVATAWREAFGDGVSFTVTWSPRAGQTDRLEVFDQSKHPLTDADVLALARSVR